MTKRDRSNSEHRCCGVVQEAAARSRAKSEKRRDKPQPWIMLKLAVGITLGIIVYAFYVYIGRFCVPMIRDNKGALGGRRIGIPFLIVFCLLGIMILWTYAKIVFTGPGKARDYVKHSPPPSRHNPMPRWWDSNSDIGGGPFVPVPPPEQPPQETQSNGYPYSPSRSNGPSTVPSAPSLNLSEKHMATQRQVPSDENAGVADAIPPIQAARARAAQNGRKPRPSNAGPPPNLQPMMFTRKPPTTPVLAPEFRYCYKDEFVKPLRAHHCRACGTCILKYDHHCPWIGQCVGAYNHKFFVNFLQWAALFCIWTFATLLAGTVKANNSDDFSVDAQEIVIIALAGLFTIFTLALLPTHIRLIVMNYTTVESMGISRMDEREKAVMARMFSFWEFGKKRQARRQWDEEWGKIGTEGNIWWLGSYMSNWEAVMGHTFWEWILPIGRSKHDGVSFPTNPRFDSEGRWRPRKEWPEELR